MPGMSAIVPTHGDPNASCGGRLVAADGRELILRAVRMRVDAAGGIARTVLEQDFESPYDEPLALVYQLPLPVEAAVSAFAFRVGERRVVGEIAAREEARRRFEDALLEGRTAALLEQERSSLFTQEIGNVPPRARVTAEITVDQRLRWLAEGDWEWRFPTVVAPRYLGAPGVVPDADRVSVDASEAGTPAAVSFELSIRDALVRGEAPRSPSHAIATSHGEQGRLVRLDANGGAALDRDLVVRWPVASASTATRLETARPPSGDAISQWAFGLLTIVPPAATQAAAVSPRDLILLIDASGSMSGAPLAQARCIAAELVRSLGAQDTLELIAFASEPERFRARAERVTPALRADALEWIAKLDAAGATEMDRAVALALTPLRADGQRQVVLVSDGLIGFEQAIVARVLKSLPARSRLHTVGVGPSVNRSLTAAAARAGRGVEIVVGLDEDGREAAQRLLAHLAAPIVTEIAVEGTGVRSCAPARLRDVAAGAPLLVSLELDPAGGEIHVRGHGFEQRIAFASVEVGTGSAALPALFARESVEDLEARAAAGEDVDAAIERIGLDFHVATRRTSWIAVSEEISVDRSAPTRRTRIPQTVPHGLSIDGLGLRKAMHMRFGLADVTFSLRAAEGKGPASPVRRSYTRSVRLHELRGPVDSHRRVCEGRILRLTASELVVEFQVGSQPLDWRPLERGVFLFGVLDSLELDEAPIGVAIDRESSTAPGTIAAGLVIRVVFRLDPSRAKADRPSAVAIRSGGARLIVTLRA